MLDVMHVECSKYFGRFACVVGSWGQNGSWFDEMAFVEEDEQVGFSRSDISLKRSYISLKRFFGFAGKKLQLGKFN